MNVIHVPVNHIRRRGWLPVYEVLVIDSRPDGPLGGAFGTLRNVWGRRRAERLAGRGGAVWVER